MTKGYLRISALTLTLFALFPACTSTNRLLKSKAAVPSAFLPHSQNLRPDASNPAWQYTANTTDRKLLQRSANKLLLYVAPVETRYLRTPSKTLGRKEMRFFTQQRQEFAENLRNEFINAMATSPAPRYRIVSQPRRDAVELRLNLLELNPTSVGGNVAKKAVGVFVGPVSAVVGIFASGSVAIEGKVVDPGTGLPLMAFADKEKDQANLISLRDFQPYGHARRAIKLWASQFDLYTRKNGQVIRDSNFFTLNPF